MTGHNTGTRASSEQVEEPDLLTGLRYCHYQLDANARKVFEALSYAYAVVETLIAKGIVGIEELDQRKNAAVLRLAERFRQEQIGVHVGDQVDKYGLGGKEVTIDCASRYPVCRAVCCKLQFALAAQDIEEGIVRWNLGRPYLNRKAESGYCVHLDQETCHCTVYGSRPAICRLYDCREDDRIWLDFEQRQINPEMLQAETDDKAYAMGPQPTPQLESTTAPSALLPDSTSAQPEATRESGARAQ